MYILQGCTFFYSSTHTSIMSKTSANIEYLAFAKFLLVIFYLELLFLYRRSA